jgi:hypothetical protein
MTLPNLRADQHAQILGFAIAGYGVSFLINLVEPLLRYLAIWNATERRLSAETVGLEAANTTKIVSQFSADFAVPLILYAIVMFAICGLTGLVIKSGFPDPKLFGLVFVVLCFGLFPLGTILGFYALIYIFVIYEREGADPESTIKLN